MEKKTIEIAYNTDTLSRLKAPFQKIHFRPKTCNNGRVLLLAYLDARDVMKRLDDVFDCDWSDDYKEVKGNLFCGITAMGITKWDCGTESNMDAEKGEASDAFKRAAVKWGIGRYSYYLPRLVVTVEKQGQNYINIKDNKTNQYVTGYYNDPKLPNWAYPIQEKK